MNIIILSYYLSKLNRGAETWAESVKAHISGQHSVYIVSGISSFLPWRWPKGNIYIPTNGRLQVAICRIVTWLINTPMVVFGHSGPGADDKWNLLCSPEVFVTFTNTQMAWAKRFKLPWTKLRVIPHAVDTKLFLPSKNKPTTRTVLCVASDNPDKRVNQVRAAVNRLPGVQFVVVGQGSGKVVRHSHMPEIYQQASLFCFVPQPWEAFGLVYLEAMATNLPVVATDDPIRREIIGSAGIFVTNPENPFELSSAINQAFDKSWGDAPLNQARQFSWELIAPLYDDLFRST